MMGLSSSEFLPQGYTAQYLNVLKAVGRSYTGGKMLNPGQTYEEVYGSLQMEDSGIL